MQKKQRILKDLHLSSRKDKEKYKNVLQGITICSIFVSRVVRNFGCELDVITNQQRVLQYIQLLRLNHILQFWCIIFAPLHGLSVVVTQGLPWVLLSMVRIHQSVP